MLFVGLKNAATLALLLLAASSLPPESEQYRQTVLGDEKLNPTEKLSYYQHYDFSSLWLKTGKGDTQNSDASVIGFIGSDYQRLRIKLLSVRPDPQQPGRYLVTGKSKVKDNVLPFQGTFTLRHVREQEGLALLINKLPEKTKAQKGVTIAEYTFQELGSRSEAGIYTGIMVSKWYLDAKKKLRYDDIEYCCSDLFTNNQFVGTWQSYKTGEVKRCNWGDWRIPDGWQTDNRRMFDRTLDIGAGEFHPDSAYLANGWQSYQDACLLPVDLTEEEVLVKKEAQKVEFAKWWQ